jgi:general secretion pathway protein D
VAAAVIPETGIINVRATSRQHEKIQEFLDQVMASARRQVLIEATVAEVTLSDGYQQGIEWSRLSLNGLGLTLMQRATGNISAPVSSLLELGYTKPDSPLGNISATVKLLDTFGTVKVLSSPKLSVLHQTAVSPIGQSAYFTIKADTTAHIHHYNHLHHQPVFRAGRAGHECHAPDQFERCGTAQHSPQHFTPVRHRDRPQPRPATARRQE